MSSSPIVKAPRQHLWGHLRQQMAWAGLLVALSLIIGIVGFHAVAGLTWVDSVLNASMLLGGMGPVGDLGDTPGKLFASGYALYAGLVFLVVGGLLITPIIHGVLHRFHLEQDDQPKPRKERGL